MNEYIMKRLVGHEIKDITEKTYAHRDFEDLYDAIKLITFKKDQGD